MRLDRIVRRGISIADSVTKSLQAEVIHHHWSGEQDAAGDKVLDPPVTRKAIVTLKQQAIRTQGGEDKMSRAQVTFLSPVEVDTQDQIFLPDGSTGQILDIQGPVDPSTGRGYAIDVWLGYQQR